MDDSRSDARTGADLPSGPPALSLGIHRLLGASVRHPMGAEFRFDPAFPLTVTLKLVVGGGASVTWRIGRGLLHTGLYAASGHGDVRVWPARPGNGGTGWGDTAWLLLEARDTSALFELPVPPLREWLADTYRVAPAEAETAGLDWDAFITDVLGAPGPPTDSHR